MPAIESASSVSSIRSTLASRVPRFHSKGSTIASSGSTDELLFSLGLSVAEALKAVQTLAENARSELREHRTELHEAVDMRCDELGARVTEAEVTKVASLERELVAVDAALEHLRSTRSTVRNAVVTLSDADLAAQHAALYSDFNDLDEQLGALPTEVVEPPSVRLSSDLPAMLAAISSFGRVHAPHPINAVDLTVENVPRAVCLGDNLRLRLSLGAHHTGQSIEELAESLSLLAKDIRVDASLQGPGIQPQPLLALWALDPVLRCLHMSLSILVASPAYIFICITRITVAGQPVAGFPVRIPLQQGIRSPLRLEFAAKIISTAPCISPEGLLFIPPGFGPEVGVFDRDGTSLPFLSVARLGLSNCVRWSAYAHGDAPSLLLAGLDAVSFRVVCVDPATRAVRWATASGTSIGCGGIAALPSRDIVVANSCGSNLFTHRLSDGVRVGSLESPGLDMFMAGDPATGTIFGGSRGIAREKCTVHAWRWAADGSGLRAEGSIAAAGTNYSSRPLAVMPPAPGKLASHLIVGVQDSPELRVLSLPGLELVHTHHLEGMKVHGLAADPWGGALAICDYVRFGKAIRVLSWPLSDIRK